MGNIDKSIFIGLLVTVAVLTLVIIVSLAHSQSFSIGEKPEVISFEFKEEANRIEVVLRRRSNSMYGYYPPRPVPDNVCKEIYGVVNGRIKLINTVDGEHRPGHYVEESILFPKQDSTDMRK